MGSRVNHWIPYVLVALTAVVLAAYSASAPPTVKPTPTVTATDAPTQTAEPLTATTLPTSEPTLTAAVEQTEEATVEADESTPSTSASGEAAALAEGDPTHGDSIFHYGKNGSPPCSSCHQTDPNAAARFSLGPNLGNLSERAGSRVEGMTVEAYLHESIVDPAAYLLPGFRNVMYPQFENHFDEQDITDLIAYLLTL